MYDETAVDPVWTVQRGEWLHVAEATLVEVERRYAGRAKICNHLPADEVRDDFAQALNKALKG
ncbi:hypothetical protein [Actinopolymorpha pittospori]|uniref:Uncharacterized protein n=1 Tax=Actinopolymorpha pittospori TaxID=648752 RepID=A0A927N6C3_9ACTN|nr:hypothetical protein [Actinopolymorpha pittospori]MBE1609777.1 hypothetical protein [Actinopolymorpha pittospori]